MLVTSILKSVTALKYPSRSTSLAGCETEMADLLLGLDSLNIASKDASETLVSPVWLSNAL